SSRRVSAAVNKWTTVVVAAAPGFEFLTVGKRGGEVCSIPVIAWELLMGEGGYEGWRPIPMGLVRGDPDNMAFAVRSPDGRVYTMGTIRTGRPARLIPPSRPGRFRSERERVGMTSKEPHDRQPNPGALKAGLLMIRQRA